MCQQGHVRFGALRGFGAVGAGRDGGDARRGPSLEERARRTPASAEICEAIMSCPAALLLASRLGTPTVHVTPRRTMGSLEMVCPSSICSTPCSCPEAAGSEPAASNRDIIPKERGLHPEIDCGSRGVAVRHAIVGSRISSEVESRGGWSSEVQRRPGGAIPHSNRLLIDRLRAVRTTQKTHGGMSAIGCRFVESSADEANEGFWNRGGKSVQ